MHVAQTLPSGELSVSLTLTLFFFGVHKGLLSKGSLPPLLTLTLLSTPDPTHLNSSTDSSVSPASQDIQGVIAIIGGGKWKRLGKQNKGEESVLCDALRVTKCWLEAAALRTRWECKDSVLD